MRRWWWHKWALRKWRRGAWRPARLPARFVAAEITGYWEARGVYARERKKLLPNEQIRPDRFNVPRSPRNFRPGIGSVFVDIDQPLAGLAADVHRSIRVIVRAAGEPLRDGDRRHLQPSGCVASLPEFPDAAPHRSKSSNHSRRQPTGARSHGRNCCAVSRRRMYQRISRGFLVCPQCRHCCRARRHCRHHR